MSDVIRLRVSDLRRNRDAGPRDLLLFAARLIEACGWEPPPEPGPGVRPLPLICGFRRKFTLSAAIGRAMLHLGASWGVRMVAERLIVRAIGLPPNPPALVARWERAPERGQADILAALSAALALCEGAAPKGILVDAVA